MKKSVFEKQLKKVSRIIEKSFGKMNSDEESKAFCEHVAVFSLCLIQEVEGKKALDQSIVSIRRVLRAMEAK